MTRPCADNDCSAHKGMISCEVKETNRMVDLWDSLVLTGVSFGFINLCLLLLYIFGCKLTVLNRIKLLFDGPVLFVIAHPDDECMFFGPTLTEALKQIGKNKVHMLCLTNGNYYGLGKIREKELVKSCLEFGMLQENVNIVNETEIQDGVAEWDNMKVIKEIISYAERFCVREIVTFDGYGVSGHPNHKAIFNSVVGLLNSKKSSKIYEHVRILSIESVNIFRKYISVFDLMLSVFSCYVDALAGNDKLKLTILHWDHILLPRNAMYQHRSQLVWFRKLYVIYSRYMFINTVKTEGFLSLK